MIDMNIEITILGLITINAVILKTTVNKIKKAKNSPNNVRLNDIRTPSLLNNI